MTLPAALEKYRRHRAAAAPWRLEGDLKGSYAAAVIIPSLAEGESLAATLRSLADNPPAELARTLAIVVVNGREDAPEPLRQQNLLDLQSLASGAFAPPPLRLAWVDAATVGRELPAGQGVGLARKIGFDLALPLLDWNDTPLLISLDADTLVEENYLPALFAHFARHREGGAVLPFRHRPEGEGSEAIELYELYLRGTVLGLELAGSPYAYHTVGSALACRGMAYVAAGGMNRRTAGEDFYFLQQLAKTSGVARLQGTVVHPSGRTSHRTPFGTGPTVARLNAGEADAVRFYHPEAFLWVGRWLDLARRSLSCSGSSLLDRAGDLYHPLAEGLAEMGLAAAWDRIGRTHASPEARQSAFHEWFDALRTRRILHRLCCGPLPYGSAEEHLPPLLERAGIAGSKQPADMLRLLRRTPVLTRVNCCLPQ